MSDIQQQTYWNNIIKPLLPVASTIIVAFGGWFITHTYNSAQIKLEKQKQTDNKTTSEIKASLSYVDFLAGNPPPSDDLKDQALLAVAPALPPELSFDLAVEALPEDDRVFKLLLRIHQEESWKYVSPFIEDEKTSQFVLKALNDQNYLNKEFAYLISEKNSRSSHRLKALWFYFRYVNSLAATQDTMLESMNQMITKGTANGISEDARAALQLAAAMSLLVYDEETLEQLRDTFKRLDAVEWKKRFSYDLGSLSGHRFYRSLSKDKQLQRKYAEMMVDWYYQYSKNGWGIPKFLSTVEEDHKDLSIKISEIFKRIG